MGSIRIEVTTEDQLNSLVRTFRTNMDFLTGEGWFEKPLHLCTPSKAPDALDLDVVNKVLDTPGVESVFIRSDCIDVVFAPRRNVLAQETRIRIIIVNAMRVRRRAKRASERNIKSA